jgi:hypothetical protein
MVPGPWRARLEISTDTTTLERRLPTIRNYVLQLSRRWPKIRPAPYLHQLRGEGVELFRFSDKCHADTPSERTSCANACLYSAGVSQRQGAYTDYGEGIDLWFKVLNEEWEVVEQVKEYYKAGSHQGISY